MGHTDYVSALAAAPDGTLISGSRDASVAVWDIPSASMTQHLTGHQYQVAAVGVTASGAIVSASLDKTIKVWRYGECSATLQGHEAAVLSLAVLPDPSTQEPIVTGSGDCTIRMWSVTEGTCTGVVKAHSDTVRALAVLPGVGVVSGSHDTTLKVWSLAGECIAEMVGHTGIVYAVSVSPDASTVVSGAEDNTARVWGMDGQCVQVIEHPGCVWATTFLPNGDVVTACADGVARVWSRGEERRAADVVMEVYTAEVAAFKEAAKPKEGTTTTASDGAGGGGGGGGDGLPEGMKMEDAAVLQAPGGREGQIVVVKEGSSGVAYSWDAAKSEWERIGEVVSGPESGGNEIGGGGGGGKKWFQGREWDFVFDVAIGDGDVSMKLPMDADENPYTVAERFLDANELPMEHKEQIVQFIIQSTGGGNTNPNTTGNFVDPYTGASAYVPSSSSGGGGGAAAATGQGFSVTGGGVDPFTGGGGGGGGAHAAKSAHLPAKSFFVFDAAPPAEGLRKKLAEFNAVLAENTETSGLAVSDAEIAADGAVGGLLASAAAAPDARSFDAAALTAVLPQLLCWPPAQLFPCLDLVRVVMLDAVGASVLEGTAGEPTLDAIPGSLGRALAEACTAQPPVLASQQVALRCMNNSFAQPQLQTWARTHMLSLLNLAAPCVSSSTKGVRLGLSSLLVNIALALTKLPGDELEAKVQVVALAVALLQSCPVEDEEPRYRALLAVGTLLPEHSQVRSVAKQLGLLQMALDLQNVGGRVGEVAREMIPLIRL